MIVMMKTKMISSKTMAKQTTLMMKMMMMTTTTTMMKMMFLKVAFPTGVLKTNKTKKHTTTETNINIPTLDYLLKNFRMKMS